LKANRYGREFFCSIGCKPFYWQRLRKAKGRKRAVTDNDLVLRWQARWKWCLKLLERLNSAMEMPRWQSANVE
jgi:hypothetical protein